MRGFQPRDMTRGVVWRCDPRVLLILQRTLWDDRDTAIFITLKRTKFNAQPGVTTCHSAAAETVAVDLNENWNYISQQQQSTIAVRHVH